MQRSAILTLAFMLAAPTAALAGPDQLQTLRAECARQLNLPAGACNCIANKAGALSELQQQFVAANVVSDQATLNRLRGQMPVSDMAAAGSFMTTAPAACASGG